MTQPIKLATLFLPHAPKGVTLPTDPAVLDDLLYKAWERGRGPWPQVSLSAEVFVTHLAMKLTQAEATGHLEELLEEWNLPDLYLACACMKEVPAAWEMLEATYLSKVAMWLGPRRISKDELSEILQTLRINLLMATPKAGPRLATYEGRGPLERWIRISVVRVAIRQGAWPREPSEETDLALMEAIPAPQPNAEFALILSRYLPEFRQAYQESLIELPSDQKLLLQMRFMKRLSTTQLGELFDVDQSTISRRLKSVQDDIYEAIKRRLKERLRLSSHEFESLFSAIRSQLDASISRILEGDRGKGKDKDKDEDKDEDEDEAKEESTRVIHP
jgi:RNA polymerase sigma-70 factor (ECF subfamily)